MGLARHDAVTNVAALVTEFAGIAGAALIFGLPRSTARDPSRAAARRRDLHRVV